MTDQLATAPASKRELFDDEHEVFRDSFRRFLEGEVVPRYEEWRSSGIPRDVFRSLGEYGFVAMGVPEDLGGPGIDDFRFNVVIGEEAMGANLAGLGLMLGAHNDVCVPLLERYAEGHERENWLRGLASGELVVALAGVGSVGRGGQAAQPGLRHSGDGWRLDGTLPGVVNGGLADVLVVAAAGGPEAGAPVLVALDARAPGVVREPADELVGPHPCDRADVSFDAVELPASAVLGDGDDEVLREQANRERLSLAVLALAGARSALALTLDYVQERRAFGQLIADFQNTRYALAAVAAEIDATEAFVDACVCEQAGGDLTEGRAASAKLRATELYGRAADTGVQLHGGYGYMLEYPIAHSFAAARFFRLHGGTSEAMKEIIAASLGI